MGLFQYIFWLLFAALVIWRGIVYIKRSKPFISVIFFFMALLVAYESSMQFFSRDKYQQTEQLLEEENRMPAQPADEQTNAPHKQSIPQLSAPPADNNAEAETNANNDSQPATTRDDAYSPRPGIEYPAGDVIAAPENQRAPEVTREDQPPLSP